MVGGGGAIADEGWPPWRWSGRVTTKFSSDGGREAFEASSYMHAPSEHARNAGYSRYFITIASMHQVFL